jgi:hypothetical protein
LKNLQKTPSAKGIPAEEKVPFCRRHSSELLPVPLGVRFLLAYKENEQQHGKHILIMITQSN